MVVDTSAILEVLFAGPQAEWCAHELRTAATPGLLSAANVTEAVIILMDRRSMTAEAAMALVDGFHLEVVPVDRSQALLAAQARLRFPLNLGDCYAYALARQTGYAILTTDRDFRSVDVPVLLPR